MKPLTERQREVVQLFADGYCAKRIAQRLGLSYATIKVHSYSAQKALGARSQAHAVAIAIRSGVI